MRRWGHLNNYVDSGILKMISCSLAEESVRRLHPPLKNKKKGGAFLFSNSSHN